MLSEKCKYAIRAVLYLAGETNISGHVSAMEVAEQLNMPVAFTSKILQELARKKIIQSVKGPHGGFWLTEENKLLPLLEIVTAVDSTTFFTDCCLGKNHCSNEHPCPVHTDFKSSREAIYHLFKSKTIKEAAREVKVNDSYIIDI